MAKYTIFLEEGISSTILLETDDYNKAEDFLWSKWHEIEGRQQLTMIGESGMTSTRQALKGNPLNEWEQERINNLKEVKKDIARHGDTTLIVRGLVKETEEDGRKFVIIA